MVTRQARIERETKESQVLVEVNLDGHGSTDVETGVPFFDHMLSQLGRHSGIDLLVRTSGDLHVDAHHTVEDTSLALGTALKDALGDRTGLRRFGDALVPLDECLVQAAIDLREEMALRRGFLAEETQREEMRRERARTDNPVRAQIMHALEQLGAAVEEGVFTVGRFLACKPTSR